MVESVSPPEGSITLIFALTNLTLVGTDSHVRRQARREIAYRQQSLTLDQQQVVIRPLPDYDEIIQNLKASRGIDVSCELLVTAASIDQLDGAIKLADDLCLLLTLARGRFVGWLCYDVVDSAGKVLRSYHRNAITKPWSPLPLIAEFPPEDTKYFLEKTYPELGKVEAAWQFRDAVSAYTDGKAEGDFLESRALKLAVTIEHVIGRFLVQTNKVHILPEDAFQAELAALTQKTHELLADTFPTATEKQLRMMANHVQGFNWYPFRRALSELCSALGLSINSTDRSRFKTMRDELVHRASFPPSYGTLAEQYLFMMTFIGKILLGILGYDGYYYDWTKPRGWIGTDMEMRVKLDLEPERRTLSEADRE